MKTNRMLLSLPAIMVLALLTGAHPVHAHVLYRYNGLFSGTNVSHDSAGFMLVRITDTRAFSAQIMASGQKACFTGVFDLSGNATNNRPVLLRRTAETLSVQLHISADGSPTMTGSVSNNDGTWVSEFQGVREVDRPVAGVAGPVQTLDATPTEGGAAIADYAGLYTMVIPGTNDSVSPGGDGFATVKIDIDGKIKLCGYLGDGQIFKQLIWISPDGSWPLYCMHNKDPLTYVCKGLIQGWVTVSPSPTQGLSGTLHWEKTPTTFGFYTNGFTNDIEMVASTYHEPGVDQLAIQLTQSDTNGIGQVVLDKSNLTEPVTVNDIVLTPLPNNKFMVPTNSVSLRLANPFYKTGLVKGSFVNPVSTNRTTIMGVILQEQNVARGFFRGLFGTTQPPGSFLLQPQ